MGFARRVADVLGDALGIAAVRKGSAWKLIEPEQLSRFLRAFQVDCVFDVGANDGQYAQRLRSIGFRGQIISFEPNPEAAATSRAAADRDPKWVVEELALDSERRTMTFNVMASSEFSSLLKPSAFAGSAFAGETATTRTISIETATIADLFGGLKAKYGFARPFLKMDTQGHDLAVAEGAGECLAEFVGLQTELALTALYEGAQTHTEALEYYAAKGFGLSGLIPNNPGHFPDLLEVDGLFYNRRHAPELRAGR